MSDRDPWEVDPWERAEALTKPQEPDAPRPTRGLFERPRPNTSAPMLPLSYNDKGEAEFDTNAGIVGSLKRTLTLPGEVIEGKVDPRSPQGFERAMEAAMTLSPMSAGAVKGGRMLGGSRVGPQTPTARELMDTGGAGLNWLKEQAGVNYNLPGVGRLADDFITRNEHSQGTARGTFGIMERLRNPTPGAVDVPFSGLHTARSELREIAKEVGDGGRPTPDARAATLAIRDLDDFIRTNDPASLAPGSRHVPDMGRRFDEANANYAAGARTSDVDRMQYKAGLQADSQHSARNADNISRQGIRQWLTRKGGTRGFNDAEVAAGENAVRGGWLQNRARFLANLFGGGGGLGMGQTGANSGIAGAGIAHFLGGDPIAAGAAAAVGVPSIGFGLKSAENAMAARGVQAFRDQVAQRSPLYQQRAAANAAAPSQYMMPYGRGAAAGGAMGASAFGPDRPQFSDPNLEIEALKKRALQMRALDDPTLY